MSIRKRGRFYWYDFAVNKIRYRGSLKACRTLADARRAEAKLLASVLDGSFVRPVSWSFKRFVEDVYLPWSKVNKRSYQSDSWRCNVLIEFFGDRRLTDIAPPLIESFKTMRRSATTERSTQRSAASVNREIELLSHIFTIASDHGILGANPCRRVRKFKLDNRRERVLGRDEEKSLMKELDKPKRRYLRAMFILALNTGMRRGEIGRLTWRDVNFEQREIFVRRSKTGHHGWIAMNAVVNDLLKGLPRMEGDDDSLIFEVTWIEKAWRTLCRDAKISDLRFHDLRHTFATRLLEAGSSLQTVRDFLGHTSASTTLRYTHGSSSAMRNAVESISQEKPPVSQKRHKMGF